MPTFDVKAASGVVPTEWDDPKIRHRRAVHKYLRVRAPTAPTLAQVVLHAIVGGVEAPADVDLGGDLFTAVRLAWSGSFPFAIVQAAGQSATITLRFAHNMLGHQELVVLREDGGALILSVDVE